jgi:hypothetical protein
LLFTKRNHYKHNTNKERRRKAPKGQKDQSESYFLVLWVDGRQSARKSHQNNRDHRQKAPKEGGQAKNPRKD